MEIVALILFLIDRDHRKTYIKVVIFSIATAGCAVIFTIVAALLFLAVGLLVINLVLSLFQEPEDRIAITDISGKVIGWLKRE